MPEHTNEASPCERIHVKFSVDLRWHNEATRVFDPQIERNIKKVGAPSFDECIDELVVVGLDDLWLNNRMTLTYEVFLG